MRSHWSCLFDIGQSLLVDIDLCAPTGLVFLTLVSHCWWTLSFFLLARFHSSCLFDIGQPLLVDIDLCAPIRLVFFDIGHLLLVDFDLCASTRLVFLTLVSHCWWTLTCALPLVLSFSHWSVAVGGLWLVRSHSSCLFFLTLVRRCWWTLACAFPLVLSFSTLVRRC